MGEVIIWKVNFWNLLIFKGTSLSIEKLASLFLFYATCCVASLIILLMEILYKPSKPIIEKLNERPFIPHAFYLQLEAIQRDLEWLASKNGKQIRGNVKSLIDYTYIIINIECNIQINSSKNHWSFRGNLIKEPQH